MRREIESAVACGEVAPGQAVIERDGKGTVVRIQFHNGCLAIIGTTVQITHDRHDDVGRAHFENGVAFTGLLERQTGRTSFNVARVVNSVRKVSGLRREVWLVNEAAIAMRMNSETVV